MSLVTVGKVLVGAAIGGIMSYGIYKGYKVARAIMDNDDIQEKNHRELMKARENNLMSRVRKPKRTELSINKEVEELSDDRDVQERVVEAHVRTGCLVPCEGILKGYVANDYIDINEVARFSLYGGLVNMVSVSKDLTREEYEATISQEMYKATQKSIESGIVSQELSDKLKGDNPEIVPYWIPSMADVLHVMSEFPRDAVMGVLSRIAIQMEDDVMSLPEAVEVTDEVSEDTTEVPQVKARRYSGKGSMVTSAGVNKALMEMVAVLKGELAPS